MQQYAQVFALLFPSLSYEKKLFVVRFKLFESESGHANKNKSPCSFSYKVVDYIQ